MSDDDTDRSDPGDDDSGAGELGFDEYGYGGDSGGGRRWLPPHDPNVGWDDLTDEDLADMVDERSAETNLVPLGGPLDDEAARDGLYADDLAEEKALQEAEKYRDGIDPDEEALGIPGGTPSPEAVALGIDDRDPGSAAGAAALEAVEAVLATRWPESKLDPSLDRIERLLDVLGGPQLAYQVVHIAGTNGKTSVARMVDSLLRALHQRTGRTTSPHLQSVTERVAVDGEPISPGTFAAAYREIEPMVEMVDHWSLEHDGPKMSYFEVLTALAFSVFADAPVDAAVVETGMGGTWDATNLVQPAVSVVTPIGIDHTEYLGDTLEAIAGEKAGIIKGPQVDVTADLLNPNESVAVLAKQDPEAEAVLLARAQEVGAVVARAGREFDVSSRSVAVGGQMVSLRGLGGEYEDIFLPLFGEHQADNAALALAAVEAFFGAGAGRQLDIERVRAGFAAVESPGRLERISQSPSIFIDAAHNAHGGKALANSLREEFDFQRLIAVVGMLQGKDARGFLREIEPLVSDIVVTETTSPRAIPVDELALLAEEIFGPDRVSSGDTLTEAVDLAIDLIGMSNPTDEEEAGGEGIIVTGSVVTAGAARAAMGKEPR